MKKLNLSKVLTVIAIAVFLWSCDNNSLKNETAITFKVKDQATNLSSVKSSIAADVVINSFKINIQEIEIEFDDNDPMFATDSIVTDYELKGPFEIDFIKNGTALETTITSKMELPSAAYDEIEFEFKKSENSISDMYRKSILIKGTIAGKPFIFWSDKEIDVEIEFEEIVKLNEASRSILNVSFDLASLFNTATGGVDITSASDGNQNGIIEIYPEDPDGNDNFADLIWEKIKGIIDAFEDKNED